MKKTKLKKNIIGEMDYTLGWRERKRETLVEREKVNEWINESSRIKCIEVYNVYTYVYILPKGDSFNFHMKRKHLKTTISRQITCYKLFFVSLPFSMMIVTTITFRLLCFQSLWMWKWMRMRMCMWCVYVRVHHDEQAFIHSIPFLCICFVCVLSSFIRSYINSRLCTIGITTCLFDLIEPI